MACPFFEPQRKLDPGPWTHVPRLPLGAAYSGVCRARPVGPHAPAEEHQRDLCNCGYARGRCSDFPADAAADAVRFSVTDETGSRLRLVYVFEKDHAPVRHGVVEWPGPAIEDEVLMSQARAFAGSHREGGAQRGVMPDYGSATGA